MDENIANLTKAIRKWKKNRDNTGFWRRFGRIAAPHYMNRLDALICCQRKEQRRREQRKVFQEALRILETDPYEGKDHGFSLMDLFGISWEGVFDWRSRLPTEEDKTHERYFRNILVYVYNQIWPNFWFEEIGSYQCNYHTEINDGPVFYHLLTKEYYCQVCKEDAYNNREHKIDPFSPVIENLLSRFILFLKKIK